MLRRAALPVVVLRIKEMKVMRYRLEDIVELESKLK
jgi:hypothetical protein